jgi:hypothetical protein
MDVTDEINLHVNHSIEWGSATWDPADFSIWNRYNSPSGRFNKAGSSEIPWDDFIIMIHESIKKGHLKNTELSAILKEIANRL